MLQVASLLAHAGTGQNLDKMSWVYRASVKTRFILWKDS